MNRAGLASTERVHATRARSRQGRPMVVGSLQYTFDDHRDAHVDELDIELAREIVEPIERTVRDTDATRVIVLREPSHARQAASDAPGARGSRDRRACA